MRSWLVKDARAHLSEVMEAALRGEPQRVTRRGKGAVVVVAEEEWRRARGSPPHANIAAAISHVMGPVGGVVLDLPPRQAEPSSPSFDWLGRGDEVT